MSQLTYAYALTGSFCTFERTIKQIQALKNQGINIIPVMSYNAYSTDTRFGKARNFVLDSSGAKCGF